MSGEAPMTAAFDRAAASYDADEEANPIKRRLRRRSLARLHEAFPMSSRLLDVGAGTGTEAVAMARAGHAVTAVDPSPAMIEVLRAKALRERVAVETRCLRACDVGELGAGAHFDGAYASFGALNMEEDLATTAEALASVVRQDGVLVVGIMTRWSFVEMAGNLVLLRPRRAFRRVSGRTTWHGHTVSYPSVRQVQDAFSPWFALERLEALNVLMPGPSAWRHLRRLPGSVSLLSGFDTLCRRLPIIRALGDHALFMFRRRIG